MRACVRACVQNFKVWWLGQSDNGRFVSWKVTNHILMHTNAPLAGYLETWGLCSCTSSLESYMRMQLSG